MLDEMAIPRYFAVSTDSRICSCIWKVF